MMVKQKASVILLITLHEGESSLKQGKSIKLTPRKAKLTFSTSSAAVAEYCRTSLLSLQGTQKLNSPDKSALPILPPRKGNKNEVKKHKLRTRIIGIFKTAPSCCSRIPAAPVSCFFAGGQLLLRGKWPG